MTAVGPDVPGVLERTRAVVATGGGAPVCNGGP
jgi:hypothetical protein